jgi:hypothetical protein
MGARQSEMTTNEQLAKNRDYTKYSPVKPVVLWGNQHNRLISTTGFDWRNIPIPLMTQSAKLPGECSNPLGSSCLSAVYVLVWSRFISAARRSLVRVHTSTGPTECR